MKNIFILFILILITNSAYSQDKDEKIVPQAEQFKDEKAVTQAEQFSATAGTLIEKKIIDIGKIKGVSIQVMKLKDLISGDVISALRFEYEYRTSYTSDTKIATLDLDEIDGLLKATNSIKNTVFKSTPDTYTEVTFISRTGFKAGAYYDVNKSKWFAYLKLEQYDSNSRVFLNTEDFDLILKLVEQAKTKM